MLKIHSSTVLANQVIPFSLSAWRLWGLDGEEQASVQRCRTGYGFYPNVFSPLVLDGIALSQTEPLHNLGILLDSCSCLKKGGNHEQKGFYTTLF